MLNEAVEIKYSSIESEKVDSESSKRLELRNAFVQRQKKNPRYSLRAFARDLGFSHTLLSLIFSGRRKVSTKLYARLQDGFQEMANDSLLN